MTPRRSLVWLTLIAFVPLVGCTRGINRKLDNLTSTVDQMKSTQETVVEGQRQSADREQEMLSLAKIQLVNQDSLLVIGRDVQGGVHQNGMSLAQVYQTVYGTAFDVGIALGETRVVTLENTTGCLNARKNPGRNEEKLFCMPNGTPIFRAKPSDKAGWDAGVVFRDGGAQQIFFAEKFTARFTDMNKGTPIEKQTESPTTSEKVN